MSAIVAIVLLVGSAIALVWWLRDERKTQQREKAAEHHPSQLRVYDQIEHEDEEFWGRS